MASSTTPGNVYMQKAARDIGSVHWWNNILYRSIAITLWITGLLTLAVAAVLVRNHPGPWPIELAFTRAVQSLPYWSWLPPIIDFFGTFNNPTPSGIGFGIVLSVILLMGWYRQAIFLALTVGAGDGIEVLIGNYVARPSASPALAHVDFLLKYSSFPSSHTSHEELLYGFLLFLSFTKPVRRWRYSWGLFPLQL